MQHLVWERLGLVQVGSMPGARDAFEHRAGNRSVRQAHGLERRVVLACQDQRWRGDLG